MAPTHPLFFRCVGVIVGVGVVVDVGVTVGVTVGVVNSCPTHQSLRERGSMKVPTSRMATRISLLNAIPNACFAVRAGSSVRPSSSPWR